MKISTSAARKLIGIASIGTLFAVTSSAFADLLYDCSLVGNDVNTKIDGLRLTTKNPLNRDDLSSSMSNLKAYCCQINIASDKCAGPKENTSNPESPYAFDQMVSRGFFKLDNKIDGSKDTKGEERAKKVKEWTESGK
ncbi:hypothetical protein KBC03_03445 [Patescibacteria group bacterium]|nr:hypothetical protein [Patescibacteria group bacterium]